MRKLFLLAVTSVFAMSAAQAMAEDATAQGIAKATIVNDVKIEAVNGEDLDFGEIISSTATNTVTVNAADGSRAASVDGSLTGRNSKAGKFTVSGSPNVQITLGQIPDITLTGAGSETMPVKKITPSATEITLDAQGKGEFTVGGELTVNAAQAAGEYEGEYTVTASY